MKKLLILLVLFLSGCASIVSTSHWPVNVQTNPSGAECLISKENGEALHTGQTPMTITLDSSRGFFLPAHYIVKCSKVGYQTSSSEINGYINGWYFGNILLGGLIGMVIVDPATGAMWRIDDKQIFNLTEVNVSNNTSNIDYTQYSQKLLNGHTTKQDVEKDLGKPGEQSYDSEYEYWAYYYKKPSPNSDSPVPHRLTLKYDKKGILYDYVTVVVKQ